MSALSFAAVGLLVIAIPSHRDSSLGMLLAFPSAEVDNNLFHFAYSALFLSVRTRVRKIRSGHSGSSVKDRAAAIVTFFSCSRKRTERQLKRT